MGLSYIGAHSLHYYNMHWCCHRIKCEEPTQSPAWSVLEGLLALVGGGDPMNASQLIKALDKIRNAHKVRALNIKLV